MSAWEQLESASEQDWETGSAVVRALDLWCAENKAEAAAVFAPDGEGGWERIQRSSEDRAIKPADLNGDCSILDLPGGFRFAYRPSAATPEVTSLRDGFGLLLSTGVRLQRMHARLKEQIFQENYNVVTLESLYDVGLRIASTLNLEELSGEILLRAVSLLDARRGALYLLDADTFGLDRTIGGDARPSLAADDPRIAALLASKGGNGSDADLLPGATHALAAPIAVEDSTKGLIVVGDKESRTGVGPFEEGDRRALALFANQAAIALENARLHRQALEKERLERELELAAEIQRGILPAAMPEVGALELAGWNRPTQQVGGDYYGSVALGNGRTGIVVADVTGKGMPAALLVSTLHSALHLLLDNVEPGAELLTRLNQHIAESSSANKFITLILVVVDPSGEEIGFVNAGHNPGLVVRHDGTVDQLDPSGLPLGLMPDSTYRFERMGLGPGDLVCLYSDGITECESPEDEEFGLERLSEFLVLNRDRPLSQIISDLDDAVSEFAAGQQQGDDQTVVLLRRSVASE